MTGLDVFLFEDGRCVEHLHEADHYTMFMQLGAPPTAEIGRPDATLRPAKNFEQTWSST